MGDRLKRALLLLTAATGTLYVGTVLTHWRAPAVGRVQGLVLAVVPLAAAAFCAHAASRSGGRRRVTWAALAAGAGAWGLGALASAVVHGPGAGRPLSYADVGYLALLPLWLVAIVVVPGAPRRGVELLGASLDALSIFVVAVTSVLAWVVDPVVGGHLMGRSATALLVYPVGDIVLLAAFVFLAARSSFHFDSAETYIGGALAALFLADSAFAVRDLHGSYRTGSPIDLAWVATFVSVGIATTRRFARDESSDMTARPQVVAIAAALATAGVLMAGLIDRRRPVLLVGAVVAAFLVVVRRFTLLFENAALLRDVREHADIAERSAHDRERFIAEAAHQLITPITSARLYSDELAMIPRDDPQFDEYVESVRKSVERLQGLTERLLTMGSFDVIRPKAPVGVTEAVREALARLDGRARLARVDLHIERLPERAYVSSSPGAIEEALVSILDNAVKYSPADATVIIAASELEDRVVITVEDEGPGIDEAKLDQVFDPFYRLGSSTAGYGLGLAIARRICDNHDATISLSRRPGGGTLGAIVWPAAQPA